MCGRGSRRTLFEVLEEYCTYFLTILLVSTQITDLDPNYRVLVKGMFISPFSIGVLYNMARHLVGLNVCSGREIEAVAAPLLLEVQALVNSPEEGEAPWSGEEVLQHFCAQVARDVRVRKIEPQAPPVRAVEDGFGGGPSPKKKAKKEYVSSGGCQQQRNVQPPVGGRPLMS